MTKYQRYGTYQVPEDPEEYGLEDLLEEELHPDPKRERLEYLRESIHNQRKEAEIDSLNSDRNGHWGNRPADTYVRQLRNTAAAEDLLAQVGCLTPVRKFEPIYKHPRGSKIPGETVRQMCDMIVDLARMEGLWPSASCADLGMSRSSLEHLKKTHVRFAEAFEYAQAEASRFWARVGTLGIVGRLPRFSASSWQFLMKNVCGWRDKMEIEAQISNLVVTAQIGSDGSVIKDAMEGEEAMRIISAAHAQVQSLNSNTDAEPTESAYEPDAVAKFFCATLAEAEADGS